MILEGYDAFEDPYAYPGTFVLRNRLDIREQVQLDAFETEMSMLRAEEPLPFGGFDAAHYCRVHHHLFQDVYEWAGKYRSVRTSKGRNEFCYPSHIATQMTSLFGELHGGKVFAQLGVDDFARRTAEFLGELNAIHPFREGNGRSQLAFIGLIGAAYGRIFQFQRLRREAFLPAMVASYFRDSRPLIEALRELLDEE